MKTHKLTTLNFVKETISKLDVKTARALVGGATKSKNQYTGCNTNCSGDPTKY